MAAADIMTAAATRAMLVAGSGDALAAGLARAGRLGELYASFLSRRADLLDAETLWALERLQPGPWQLEHAEAARLMNAALGEAGRALVASLSPEPLASDPFRCHFATEWEGGRAVVEFTRPWPEAGELESFRGHLRQRAAMREVPEALRGSALLAQFERWLRAGAAGPQRVRLQEDLWRCNSEGGPVRFARPFVELCLAPVLTTVRMPGLAEATLDRPALVRIARAFLAMVAMYGLVPADSSLAGFSALPDGSAAMPFGARFLAVPPRFRNAVLKYVAAAIAGDSVGAARSVLRLTGAPTAPDVLAQLLGELSAIEPDSRANLPYPASVALLDTQWRALSRMELERPLFLDCLHRNFTELGLAAARTAMGGSDLLEEAYWPVLGALWGRNLRGAVDPGPSSTGTLPEWLLGSGVLMAEGLRQAGRLAEDLRDRDLGFQVGVASAEDRPPAGAGRGGQTLAPWLSYAFLLAGLLVLTWWSLQPSAGSAAVWIAVGAGLLALLLAATICRIGE